MHSRFLSLSLSPSRPCPPFPYSVGDAWHRLARSLQVRFGLGCCAGGSGSAPSPHRALQEQPCWRGGSAGGKGGREATGQELPCWPRGHPSLPLASVHAWVGLRSCMPCWSSWAHLLSLGCLQAAWLPPPAGLAFTPGPGDLESPPHLPISRGSREPCNCPLSLLPGLSRG